MNDCRKKNYSLSSVYRSLIGRVSSWHWLKNIETEIGVVWSPLCNGITNGIDIVFSDKPPVCQWDNDRRRVCSRCGESWESPFCQRSKKAFTIRKVMIWYAKSYGNKSLLVFRKTNVNDVLQQRKHPLFQQNNTRTHATPIITILFIHFLNLKLLGRQLLKKTLVLLL